MKYIFIPLLIITFITGCGLMNNTKDEPIEKERIHVPQKITVEIPRALKADNSQKHQATKAKYPQWYN